MKKVLFLLNEKKDSQLNITKEIVEYLISKNCLVYLEDELNNKLTNTCSYSDDLDVDFCIILGGDGTILNFAHKYEKLNLPFFGINLGRVGCLAEGELNDYKEKIDKILSGNYYIEERNTISCSIYRDNLLSEVVSSFNEVCVQKGKLYKMIQINMLVNGKNETSFFCDGVIIATSTGSSAYNLSSCGPLLLPSAKNFVITPVCPQLRAITSLVVNDTDVIELTVKEDADRESYNVEKPVVVIDGYKEYDLSVSDKVIVKKGNKSLRIIKVNDNVSLFEPIFKVAMSSKGMFIKSEENK